MNDKIGIEADVFLKDYYKMVYSVAKKYMHSNEYEDIVQEGMIGLMKAYIRFDPEVHKKFSTFAYKFIYGEIKHFFRDKSKLIRLPRTHNKIKELVYNEEGIKYTVKELADIVGCSEKQVKDILFIIFNGNIVHADKDVGEGEEKETYFERFVGNKCDYTEIIVDDFINRINDKKIAMVIEYALKGYNKKAISDIMGYSSSMGYKYLLKAQKIWIEYENGEI